MELKKEITFPIMEIFKSIQGEGTMMGQPATFIRFHGCNMACPWCDTKDSWKNSDAKVETLNIGSILDKCTTDLVVLTGGEPCIQPHLEELITALRINHYVAIETNGSLPTPVNADWITCSPKPPLYHVHPKCVYDELKFVMCDDLLIPNDIDRILLRCRHRDPECVPVWLQPNGEDMQRTARLAYEHVLKHKQYKLGVQLHKIFDFK